MACQNGSAPNWVQWGAQPLQRPQQHWKRVTTKGAFHQSRSNFPPKLRRRWDVFDHPELSKFRRPFYDVAWTSGRRLRGR